VLKCEVLHQRQTFTDGSLAYHPPGAPSPPPPQTPFTPPQDTNSIVATLEFGIGMAINIMFLLMYLAVWKIDV
jgi:hypothetical protein